MLKVIHVITSRLKRRGPTNNRHRHRSTQQSSFWNILTPRHKSKSNGKKPRDVLNWSSKCMSKRENGAFYIQIWGLKHSNTLANGFPGMETDQITGKSRPILKCIMGILFSSVLHPFHPASWSHLSHAIYQRLIFKTPKSFYMRPSGGRKQGSASSHLNESSEIKMIGKTAMETKHERTCVKKVF